MSTDTIVELPTSDSSSVDANASRARFNARDAPSQALNTNLPCRDSTIDGTSASASAVRRRTARAACSELHARITTSTDDLAARSEARASMTSSRSPRIWAKATTSSAATSTAKGQSPPGSTKTSAPEASISLLLSLSCCRSPKATSIEVTIGAVHVAGLSKSREFKVNGRFIVAALASLCVIRVVSESKRLDASLRSLGELPCDTISRRNRPRARRDAS